MVRALVVNLKKRASVDELLKMDFIKLGSLDKGLSVTPIEETNVTEYGSNLYKFMVAHCFIEIIQRYNLAVKKCKEVNKLKFMFEAKHRNKGEGAVHYSHDKHISVEHFVETLIPRLGEYEAMQLAKFFREHDFETLTF